MDGALTEERERGRPVKLKLQILFSEKDFPLFQECSYFTSGVKMFFLLLSGGDNR